MRTDVSVGLSLTASEVPAARGLWSAELAREDSADGRLAAGLVDYLLAWFAEGREHLRSAFLTYHRRGDRRRAAVTAAHLGRLEHDGVGHLGAANGWFARAERLVSREERCAERGWVILGRVGCSFVDTDELDRAAREALDLADAFGDVDLECKALADLGLALVNQGRTDEGTTLLDEAMTMAGSGECDNAFITAQVYCCVVSACERSGALDRMEAILPMLQGASPGRMATHASPTMLLSHCQGEYGSLLCGSGRWREADAALRLAVQVGERVHFRPRARAYAALADLRVSQGRLAEASAALEGYAECIEAQLPLARLHLARGDSSLAAAVARSAVRLLGGDTMRSAPLRACLVQADLARGELDRAEEASNDLYRLSAATNRPQVRAVAALTQARVARAAGSTEAAITHVEEGLAALPEGEWPLIGADLRLELATLLGPTERIAALAEARQALNTYALCGSARMHDAQALLHVLGDSVVPTAGTAPAGLTSRERQVLRLVADGASNPDIARTLVISTKTAEHHVSNILRKLGLRSRSEAAVYAATLGVAPPS